MSTALCNRHFLLHRVFKNLYSVLGHRKIFGIAKMAQNGNDGGGDAPPKKASKKGGTEVEDIYQRVTQLEHILLRPDTYIGSVEHVSENMWVYNSENSAMEQRTISYVPGLYKIFDEILVNAADNKQRDPGMDCIKIDIKPDSNQIVVWNNGTGIPVVEHKDEKMFVPTMIFGHLLTSSNYNDEEAKVTGGRNGYGAKLCNIFSTKFTVETASKEYKKTFKQSWGGNMSKAGDPHISSYSGSDFTKVTFCPDLKKFKMEGLDKDIMDLMSRRAYDVAASTRGVKVFLNGERVKVKNFKDYVDLYIKNKTDDSENPLKVVHEQVNDRWEVAVTTSSDNKGFLQVSFVNSIATTKGGRHVDHVVDAIVKDLSGVITKKNKGGHPVKPFQIKSNLWVFVNCLIVNPTFDSQTKEQMTLAVKSFGSKCALSPAFLTKVAKCGVVDQVLSWAKFKEKSALDKKGGSKKNKLTGIPKLMDANDAGTARSLDCTLILTEGDSAMTTAVGGLGIIGRDKYGAFPLRGKLLNVRDAGSKQVGENVEINNIIKIMGLQFKRQYNTPEDMKTLRYGRMMIMTDQDQDGSHIKGLLINFIHTKWPSLLKVPFLEEFITPIVKASKGKNEVHPFYSLPEFEEWKAAHPNWPTYTIKYYKGLGTSTPKETKEYFSDMKRHRILFYHNGPDDDHHIKLAFSKSCIEQRKDWLTTWMEDSKRRRELGLKEEYLYLSTTTKVHYTDFINKELVLFSNADNERSIPNMVDGLKPGQRKVLFVCMQRNDKKEVKVAQLAGAVGEKSAYHHGEASLHSTIVHLAQNFVGSNNINLLQPIGQFGTRLQGGKDAASPRYIFTKLSPLTRLIFHPSDDPLMKTQFDDGMRIEPVWYMPIIPMVLVNGSDGIGTGWMTKIPNHNPREIIENIKRMINGEEPMPMLPWYKHFKGEIEQMDNQRFIVYGEVAVLDEDEGKVEITELPVGVWTQAYKENVLEPMSSSEKTPAVIQDYKEYNTDTTVRFVVQMSPEKLRAAEREGLHKFFKIQSSLATTSMCLFDSEQCMTRYDTVMDILQDFYKLRLSYYVKRKAYLEGVLQAEALKLSNQARFIVEKCDGRLVIENKKKKLMVEELRKMKYDADPVRAWKLRNNRDETMAAEADARRAENENTQDSQESQDEPDDVELLAADYDYLLSMAFWSVTAERKEDILKRRDTKLQELKTLQETSVPDLWRADLDALLVMLDKVEDKEKKDENVTEIAAKAAKVKQQPGKRANAGVKKNALTECLPSPMARRIAPKIDDDLRKKFRKAGPKGPKKTKAADVEELDEYDLLANREVKTLQARLGTSPSMIEKAAAKKKNEDKGPKLKQTKLNFNKAEKKRKPNSDSESDALSEIDRVDDVLPSVSRQVTKRTAAAKAKFVFDSDESDDDDLPKRPVNGAKRDDSDASDDFIPRKRKISSDSEDSNKSPNNKPANQSSDAMFDSLVGLDKHNGGVDAAVNISSSSADSSPIIKKAPPPKKKLMATNDDAPPPKKAAAKKTEATKKPPAAKKPAAKPAPKRKNFSDSSNSDSEADWKTKSKKPVKKTKKKKGSDSDGSNDDFVMDSPHKASTTGRQRKPVTYTLDDPTSSDDD